MSIPLTIIGVTLGHALFGATRAKPIILAGLAVMFGAFFILDDANCNGPAISLIFWVLV